jgi:hypothetical protein
VNNVWGIVLGAVLAVATTMLVEYFKFKWNETRSKRLFRTLLQIEMPLILTTLDTLIEEHQKQDSFVYFTFALLPVQRQGFDRGRDQIVLFTDAKFREDVIDFYQRLGTVTTRIDTIERQLIAHPDQAAWAAKERIKSVGTLRDVRDRGRDLLQRVPQAK